MIHTQEAQREIDLLTDNVIGLFKVGNKFELIVNVQYANETVDTLNITQFGAIQINYNVPICLGQGIMFPNDKNMNQMFDNPFEFDAFIKSFV